MTSLATSRPVSWVPASLAAPELQLKQAVFDRFVYGLLVVDGRGRILCRNGAAARILESVGGGATSYGTTCCAVLRCEEAGDCPTRATLSAEVDLPGIRRDLHSPEGHRAVWISAFKLETNPATVLLELRPCDVFDRRRRADPGWRSATPLRVTTLGRTAVLRGEVALEGGWLDQRAGDLLRYLIVRRGRPVTADEIGEALWREPGYHVVRNVRTTVHRLRQALEPGRPNHQASNYLLTQGGSYRLDLDLIELDIEQFEAGVKRGLASSDSDPDAAAKELVAATALYGGELFPESPFAEWALAERARLHDFACDGLNRLATLQRRAGQIELARSALERLATLQPLDEGVCRKLLELDIAAGRHSDAKRRYDRLAHQMHGAIGYQPRFTLADLAPCNQHVIQR